MEFERKDQRAAQEAWGAAGRQRGAARQELIEAYAECFAGCG